MGMLETPLMPGFFIVGPFSIGNLGGHDECLQIIRSRRLNVSSKALAETLVVARRRDLKAVGGVEIIQIEKQKLEIQSVYPSRTIGTLEVRIFTSQQTLFNYHGAYSSKIILCRHWGASTTKYLHLFSQPYHSQYPPTIPLPYPF